MKIRLALLDTDRNYIQRFVSNFSARYSEKIEIYSFTNTASAIDALTSEKIDVFLVNEEIEINTEKLPRRCTAACLSEGNFTGTISEKRYVGKYQRLDVLYKSILSLYAENAGPEHGIIGDGLAAHVLLFASPSGGAGSSTMALACAMSMAEKGKKTLYLNAEVYSGMESVFPAETGEGLSDVLYALKSGKSSINLKLEGVEKEDAKGFNYYVQCAYPQDVLSWSKEDVSNLLDNLFRMGRYEYIVIDTDFTLCDQFAEMLRRADYFVITGDGSEISNKKLVKGIDTLRNMEEEWDTNIIRKVKLIYNKFSSSFGKLMEIPDIASLGGVHRIQSGQAREIAEQIVREKKNVFDSLM